jgi:hypothetical protein
MQSSNSVAEKGVNPAFGLFKAVQRPARSFSPAPVARVHGAQPIDR